MKAALLKRELDGTETNADIAALVNLFFARSFGYVHSPIVPFCFVLSQGGTIAGSLL